MLKGQKHWTNQTHLMQFNAQMNAEYVVLGLFIHKVIDKQYSL